MTDDEKRKAAQEHHRLIQSLVQREMLAGVFATIRAKGVDAGLKELAEQYKQAFGENCHVEWYLQQEAL